MATVTYQGRIIFVSSDPDIFRDTPIRSFSVGKGSSAQSVTFNSTNEAVLLSGLKQAADSKGIAIFKAPSKDDLDAVLIDMFHGKKPFGFNLDIYAVYTGKAIQFVHFFQEDATISEQPIRVGRGKDVLLKLEVSLPKADFKRGYKSDGKWVDDDYWK